MKKIVITGGLGYIGMELSKIYSGKANHYDITVIDNSFFSEGESATGGIRFLQVDIRDKKLLKKILIDSILFITLQELQT